MKKAFNYSWQFPNTFSKHLKKRPEKNILQSRPLVIPDASQWLEAMSEYLSRMPYGQRRQELERTCLTLQIFLKLQERIETESSQKKRCKDSRSLSSRFQGILKSRVRLAWKNLAQVMKAHYGSSLHSLGSIFYWSVGQETARQATIEDAVPKLQQYPARKPRSVFRHSSSHSAICNRKSSITNSNRGNNACAAKTGRKEKDN